MHADAIWYSNCAVCRIDLHIIDGELPTLKSPLIPGHQAFRLAERARTNARQLTSGKRSEQLGLESSVVFGDSQIATPSFLVARSTSGSSVYS